MYVGIDYHKRYAVATSMDDRGKVIEPLMRELFGIPLWCVVEGHEFVVDCPDPRIIQSIVA